MTLSAIVLAGGLGTRLQSVEPELPKVMVEVGGRPFLEHQLDYLAAQGLSQLTLSVGVKHEHIQKHFGHAYRSIQLTYCVEDTPLGTGGAMLKALECTSGEILAVLNGDTYFPVPLESLVEHYRDTGADVALALKEVEDAERYGTVRTDAAGRIIHFAEAGARSQQGVINGGIYIVARGFLQELSLPEKCSFEQDVLKALFQERRFFGRPFREYFIDIGIPQDLEKARRQLS